MTLLLRHKPVKALRALVLAAIVLVALLAAWSAPVLQNALTGTSPGMAPDVCVVAPPTPYDPASGLPLTAPRVVPADARCPVCGMYPARSQDWAAQVIFGNGDAQFFDSPLSLLVYLHDVARYSPGHHASDIVASYVSDADSGHWVPARNATYVQGSSARGPMRTGNLPAFAEVAAAQRFINARGGELLSASDVTQELLQRLRLKAEHGH